LKRIDGKPVRPEDLKVSVTYWGGGKGRWKARPFTAEELPPTDYGAAWGERTGDLFLNENAYFGNVPELVWNYQLGGYPVLKKWLGYRQADRRDGKPLTDDERKWFRQIIQRVAALLALGPLLNGLYEQTAANAFTAEELQGCRVGVLIQWPENDPRSRASVSALTRALADFGWVEGKNIRIDYRFAADNPTLFKTYAAELVGLSPDAILASTTPGLAAVREQTRTIPIVFVHVSDPLGQGFVQSLARPGGNITGFTDSDAPVLGKWLQLLKDIAPSITRVAVIFNPGNPALDLYKAIEAAAPSLRMMVTLAPVRDDAGIEEAIAAQAREPNGGLIVLPSPFNTTREMAIAAAAVRHRLPLISGSAVTRAGGLMSYWIDGAALYTQAAPYIDRILKGASPSDLPVQQPTRYKLIINLKTAKALGLTVPERVLDIADELIE
jgi:putative ABC transport system substrate-binding protein